MKLIVTITITLSSPLILCGQCDTIPLSLSEALCMAHSHNTTLAIANQAIEGAAAQKDEIEALWLPTIALTGEYTHTLQEIAVESSLGEIGGEIATDIEAIASTNPLLGQIISSLRGSTFRLPIAPRNTAMIGVDLGWTIFSGGRRIGASRIAGALVDMAENQRSATYEMVSARVISSYFTTVLAEKIVEVRRTTLSNLKAHLREATLLEREGQITSTERMVAEVKVEQAAVLLSSALANLADAHDQLSFLLGRRGEFIPLPTTSLFSIDSLPVATQLQQLINSSPTIATIDNQEQILQSRLSMERSRYLPSVALLGHQQLWSSGLNKNLIPRTLIGVGLSWTLFDGLSRKSAIRRTKSEIANINSSRQLALDNLTTTTNKLHRLIRTQIEQYASQLSAQHLAERVATSTRKAFSEGVATSMEVADTEQLSTEAKLATLLTLFTIDSSIATLLSLCGQIDAYDTFMPSASHTTR